jgi:hypothetical protein
MIFAMSTFWQVFVILIVWIPLILLWVFALVELFRNRDGLEGWQVALWLLGIVFLPIVGPAVYLVYQGMHSEEMQHAIDFQAEVADERGSNPNAGR